MDTKSIIYQKWINMYQKHILYLGIKIYTLLKEIKQFQWELFGVTVKRWIDDSFLVVHRVVHSWELVVANKVMDLGIRVTIENLICN